MSEQKPISDERWAHIKRIAVSPLVVEELIPEIDRLRAALDEAEQRMASIPSEYRDAGRVLAEMAIRADRAEAALARVKALHHEGVAYADDIDEGTDVPDDYERHFCHEDGEDWPCATIRALEGATE